MNPSDKRSFLIMFIGQKKATAKFITQTAISHCLGSILKDKFPFLFLLDQNKLVFSLTVQLHGKKALWTCAKSLDFIGAEKSRWLASALGPRESFLFCRNSSARELQCLKNSWKMIFYAKGLWLQTQTVSSLAWQEKDYPQKSGPQLSGNFSIRQAECSILCSCYFTEFTPILQSSYCYQPHFIRRKLKYRTTTVTHLPGRIWMRRMDVSAKVFSPTANKQTNACKCVQCSCLS